jgi:CHASE2 domain-containing sensor protein/tRNA A-37 threonylcarbamoyl transferase component Bud32
MKKTFFHRTDILIGALVACIFIFLSFSSFHVFESLERIIYGIEMRLDLPQNRGRQKIAIVNIDKKSLEQLGPWPWPRHLIAEMISILKNNGAKIIGLDLLFSARKPSQGLKEVQELYQSVLNRQNGPQQDVWILNALKEVEKRLDNDSILSQTVKASGNIIMPVSGSFGKYDTELVLSEDSFMQKKLPKMKVNIDSFPPVNQLTTPFPELFENSHGLGHTNLSPVELMKGQVHLLFINYRGHLVPSMPLRLTLDYLNKQPEEILIQGEGIRLTDSVIPAFKGEIFVKFIGGRRSFPYYSFSDILKVKKVPAVFEDKIVLIGYTADGTSAVNTPVDTQMPRVELMANIIENLMSGRYLQRPGFMIYLEVLFLLLLTFFASFAIPHLSFINRVGITMGLIFLAVFIGIVFFIGMDLWFKAIYISLALVTVYAVLSVKDFIIRQQTLGLTSKESIETNRMLGLSLQSQGLLDLAFEKFRKCPLDDAMKDVIYNLGLDYERKRMINKAVSVYEYILQLDNTFRKLNERIPKLRKLIGPLSMAGQDGKKQAGKIVVSDDLGVKPTVGRYEIIDELGQGAMGIVYKAKDPRINRLLAIKTIRFADEFEEEKLADVKGRFLREAEIAGKLSHRSVVSIYDVGEDYDLTYMAMEFLEGENLQKYCRKGNLLPLRKILFIVGETASALNYAHSNGVIHRDIKPANIMLLKDGKIKVTDFGIAKAVSSSETKSGIILGTPNYMSPEQINGQKIDGRSDIFSLGVVFYELLTGQLPFHGKTLTNLFYQITQGKHPSPRSINPNVPKPCEQIIDKALTKNPENRFQDADEFAKYLRLLINKLDEVTTSSTE